MKGTRSYAATKMMADMEDDFQPDEVEEDDPELPDANEVGKWDVSGEDVAAFTKKRKE